MIAERFMPPQAPQRTRPPRVLVTTPLIESKLYVWEEFTKALAEQQTDLLWDMLVVDNTDEPSPGYVEWLKHWCQGEPMRDEYGNIMRNRRGDVRWSGPFGKGRPVRLLRFGRDVDGSVYRNPLNKVAFAEQLAWGKFCNWLSYDYLMSLECDVLMPRDAMQKLYEADLPWAAAWMTSREMVNPFEGSDEEERVTFPLLFHGLDLEAWRGLKDWKSLTELGYLEPPSEDPFPCVVTHLGCTLLRGDVVRSVPFRLTSAGGDVCYSWDCAANGYQPMCVPAVKCQHVAADERPPYNRMEVP